MTRKLLSVLATLAAAFTLAVLVPTAAHADVQSVPNNFHPWCVTYLPNAAGLRPDQNCYSDQTSFLNEVHNWTRLGTSYQDINFNGGSPAGTWRLAAVTRRTLDGSGCTYGGGIGFDMDYMPTGWNETTDPGGNHVSSFSRDDGNCSTADLFSSYDKGGTVVNCHAACSDLRDYGINDNVNSEYFHA